jgi:hypothetical protein
MWTEPIKPKRAEASHQKEPLGIRELDYPIRSKKITVQYSIMHWATPSEEKATFRFQNHQNRSLPGVNASSWCEPIRKLVLLKNASWYEIWCQNFNRKQLPFSSFNKISKNTTQEMRWNVKAVDVSRVLFPHTTTLLGIKRLRSHSSTSTGKILVLCYYSVGCLIWAAITVLSLTSPIKKTV